MMWWVSLGAGTCAALLMLVAILLAHDLGEKSEEVKQQRRLLARRRHLHKTAKSHLQRARGQLARERELADIATAKLGRAEKAIDRLAQTLLEEGVTVERVRFIVDEDHVLTPEAAP